MTNTPSPTRGRPSKLTPELVDSLVQAVEANMTRADAAEYAGISAGTFARWLTLGRKVLDAGGGTSEFEVRCATLRLRVGVADEARKGGTEPAASPNKIPVGVIKAGPLQADAITTVTVGQTGVSNVAATDPFAPAIVVGKPRRRSLVGRVLSLFNRDRVHLI
ncbi:hypothetical protein AB0I69_42630 [Streptomyces sp. NPDC050508]|uniref:hypothetical protein n=1 Tax=Streptomyces sp. NPDC050508 TaxID=3155405 RepID=UPI0034163A98